MIVSGARLAAEWRLSSGKRAHPVRPLILTIKIPPRNGSGFPRHQVCEPMGGELAFINAHCRTRKGPGARPAWKAEQAKIARWINYSIAKVAPSVRAAKCCIHYTLRRFCAKALNPTHSARSGRYAETSNPRKRTARVAVNVYGYIIHRGGHNEKMFMKRRKARGLRVPECVPMPGWLRKSMENQRTQSEGCSTNWKSQV
jgi:hypothetical protein